MNTLQDVELAIAGAENEYKRRAIQARHLGRIPIRGLVDAKWDRSTGRYVGKPIGPAIDAALDEQIAAAGDSKSLAATAAKLERVRNDTSGMEGKALAGIRLQTANNFLTPSLRWAAAFGEVIVLKDDEAPYFQNNTLQEVTVRTATGQDGDVHTTKVVRPQEEVSIALSVLKTDFAEYTLNDIYNGSVVEAALANINLARDAAAALESKLRSLAASVFGSFTLTGAAHKRTYNPHSFINSSNLPTTNDFTIDSTLLTLIGNSGGTVNSSSTGFRKEVLDVITWYAASWGDAFTGGPVTPTGVILVPSSDVASIGVSIGLNTARLTELAENIQANGYSTINYLGRVFTLVPDNTLAPKTCYVPFNRPLFTLFLKPSMDREKVVTDELNNKERRAISKVWGYYSPIQAAPNGIRIKYRT